jgi:hypothetical protein
MAKETRTPQQASADPAAIPLLERAQALGIGTAFSRADQMAPCPIGSRGMCCSMCLMGPCRITKDGQVGVCGATLETIGARVFARHVAAGSAAHSDHGRDLAFTLKAAAKGEAKGFKIRDPYKLKAVAGHYGIPTEGRALNDIAIDVADKAIAEFGQQKGELAFLKRAPAKRHKLWQELEIAPRGIDREVVEVLHRTHMGDDQDAEHILDQAMRCALSDGWGGSMIATDLSDILFGTPSPLVSAGQPGRAQGRRGQHHHPRPRTDAGRDAGDCGQRPRTDRLRQEQGRGRPQHGGHLLHLQRDAGARGHPVGGQLPAPGAGDPHRRRGGDGGGRAVHHAGAAGPGQQLPHGDHHHLAEGQDPGRDAHPLRRAQRL